MEIHEFPNEPSVMELTIDQRKETCLTKLCKKDVLNAEPSRFKYLTKDALA